MERFYPEGQYPITQKSRQYLYSPSGIAEACRQGTVLEATATVCDTKRNLLVDLGCMKGIIPHSEGAMGIEDGTTRDIALLSRVGKPVAFTVTELKTDENGKLYAVLSRRQAQEKCINEYISMLSSGDVIDAKITHLEPFGAFCDIGCGVISLLPINSVSVSRISHPKDRFYCGQDIKAVVVSNDSNGRITLSHRELLGTWEENCADFSQGETVSGIIRSVEDYGIFVELSPNLAGLAEPCADVRVGQTASVYIKNIIPEKMKVKLIIIDSFFAPYTPICKYYVDSDHIDRWDYSPASSDKKIFTEFQ